MSHDYVPLSQRSAAQLRKQAERYRHMAATAGTAEVKNGLLRLAVRLDGLVDQRELMVGEGGSQPE